jgi:hypothetical protein
MILHFGHHEATLDISCLPWTELSLSCDPIITTPLDPPHQSHRVRLVCEVLDTCGSFFNRGSNKKKLDAFLLYLQRFYLTKWPISLEVHLHIINFTKFLSILNLLFLCSAITS